MKAVPAPTQNPTSTSGLGNSASAPVSSSHAENDWQDLVYELAPLAYLNFDAKGRLLDFNVAAARLLGVSRKRDLNRPLADFVSTRHQRRLLKHIQQSLISPQSVVTRVQLRGRPDNDTPSEVEISTRPSGDSTCYRTQLLPICGAEPIAWPDGDAKFRALVENSSEVVCIGAPDGTIFYTTPSVRRVLGYEPASWFGRNAFEIMLPEHAALARPALRNLAAGPTGSVLRLEAQIRHHDGSWRWVEAILTNLIGKPAVGGIVCNYRDITEARVAAEALRTSEQRYRLLAESLPQLVCIQDAEGHIEYCNSLWCSYRGVDCSKSATYDWTTGIPPEDVAAMHSPEWPDGKPRPWESEVRIPRAADNALRWHSVRAVPIEDPPGSATRWLGIATDIHERKQAEQERERLVQQLQQERSDLAVQYAVVRVLAWANNLENAAPHLLAAFCDQLGWEAGALWAVSGCHTAHVSLSPVHIHQQQGLTPGGSLVESRLPPLRKGQSLAGRVWQTKAPLSIATLSRTRGAAHHRTAATLGLRSAFAFPILCAGEVQGVVELFAHGPFEPSRRLVDIVSTIGIQIGLFIERTRALGLLRQSEEALKQSNNALEQRVHERTMELHEANRELSAEISERTRLEREIIRISEREQRRIGQDLHDGVCQELAAIALMSRALATRMGRSGAPETQRVNDVAQLLNDSITRCRDIARGLHPVEMDTDGLMVALNDLAVRTNKTVSCSFQCKEPILMQESDMALNLYRIAQEAVNNALKYSGAGRITLSFGREGASLRLAIRDDGSGIPARDPAARHKRSGMGLHIMRYRARTMGATLRIRDLKPRGTEVSCLLPHK